MLDVRRMRVLREVANRGSITAAAQALSFTPSAVSQQIAALEREAGIALVERGPRSIRLTEAGIALVGHTDEVLARLQAAEARHPGDRGASPRHAPGRVLPDRLRDDHARRDRRVPAAPSRRSS